MSPGNSYFRDEVVTALLKSVIEKYGKAVVLIPDVPAVSTYLALGYAPNRAWRDKALPQGNALRNKVERSVHALGYAPDVVKCIDWKGEIESNPNYVQHFEAVQKLYDSNTAFQLSANDATQKVLEYSDKEIPDLVVATKTAVHYLLSELAFMEFAPEYLQTEKAVYIYHRDWPVYEDYIAGTFDQEPRSKLDFEIVTTA